MDMKDTHFKFYFITSWFVHRDNDRSSLNCASMLKGGWWWKSCGRGLNGLYLNDPQDLTARQGMEDDFPALFALKKVLWFKK